MEATSAAAPPSSIYFTTTTSTKINQRANLGQKFKVSLFKPVEGLKVKCVLSSEKNKRLCAPRLKASNITDTQTSEIVGSGNGKAESPTKSVPISAFPNGYAKLVSEVCDSTEIAELKVKIGEFEMHMKRHIEATRAPTIVSPVNPPPIPSEPMIESGAAATLLEESPQATTSPFANLSLEKSPKLAALDAIGTNAYVLVYSPAVGFFRRGKTTKGKKHPPVCKEGSIIKEGQILGYIRQLESEVAVKSDVAGEVVKILYREEEPVGYGDPIMAVSPSFHGIEL